MSDDNELPIAMREQTLTEESAEQLRKMIDDAEGRPPQHYFGVQLISPDTTGKGDPYPWMSCDD